MKGNPFVAAIPKVFNSHLSTLHFTTVTGVDSSGWKQTQETGGCPKLQ